MKNVKKVEDLQYIQACHLESVAYTLQPCRYSEESTKDEQCAPEGCVPHAALLSLCSSVTNTEEISLGWYGKQFSASCPCALSETFLYQLGGTFSSDPNRIPSWNCPGKHGN